MVTPISQITVYSNASTLGSTLVQVGTFPVDNSSQRSATLRGEDSVKLCFKSGTRIDIPAFSFIEYEGQIFFTKELYRPLVKGGYYEYSVKFVSFDNMLSKPQAYRHVVVDNEEWNEPEMDLNGDLQAIAEVVLGSITSCSSRYEGVFAYLLSHVELGTVKQGTQSKTFNFSEQKVSQVLEAIANDYEIDYWFEQVGNIGSGISKMKLHFCKLERTDRDMLVVSDEIATTDDPKHPTQSLGLKECSFANEWSGVVHRLTPYGSDRNMKRQQAIVNDMYVSFGKRLRLQYDHSCTINGTTYQHAYAIKNEDGETEPLYVDENNAITIPGVTTGEESVEKYEDIYPRGHFRVTHVTQRGTEKPIYTVYAIPTEEHNGVYTDLTDAQIDAMQADETKRLFPIQIAEGQTLSLHFESGFLNGREFEVANKSAVMKWEGDAYKVDPANGHWVACFEIEPTGDNNESPQVPFGTLVPRGKFDEQVYEGDIFAIFNMDMPAYYLESAQNELAQAAYDKMVGILSTRPEVKCRGNETFFATHDMFLGQRVQVTSELFGSTVFVSRVTSFSHSLSKPNDVDFRLCSSGVQGSISMMKAAISDQTSSIQGVQQTARSISRRAFRDVAEMKDMLESVTAEMMVVGVEKNQFVFTMGIECLEATTSTLTRKFDGLQITAGEIQHSQDAYIKEAFNGKYIVDACTLRTDVLGGYIDKNADQTHRETPYYLYAHINTTTGKATMELHSGKKDDTSPESDHDYLLLGILSSEFPDGTESLRVFNRSNGFTSMAGGTITTEQIQDPTRQLIIDMSSNPPRIIARNGAEIIGNIKFISSSGQQRTVEDYIDDALDGLDLDVQVGVRNLLRDTAFTKKGENLVGWEKYTMDGHAIQTNADSNTVDSGNVKIVFGSSAGYIFHQTCAAGSNKQGDKYTFSAKAKVLSGTTALSFGEKNTPAADRVSANLTTSYQDIKLTIEVGTLPSGTQDSFVLYTSSSCTVLLKEVKLEKGTVATSWTQAPEDTAAEIAENRNYIGTIQEDLQKQIDGVVDSYFMEGVPTMDDTKKPLSDWKTEGGGTIDYAKHEGDTYTNIQSYIGLDISKWEQGRVYIGSSQRGHDLDYCKSTSGADHNTAARCKNLITYKNGDKLYIGEGGTPITGGTLSLTVYIAYFDNDGLLRTYTANAVKGSESQLIDLSADYSKCNISVRSNAINGSTPTITPEDIMPLGLCVNPTAGHSWRFCNYEDADETTWHWHEIADSDAVKALQDAAAAQDTADGKRRCFVSQPVPPYDPGDLWANATYSGGGVEYDNVLLKCKAGCGKTKNQSFAISDWEDSSRAISAADTAQAAADDAMQKAEDIANDGIISGGTEKATLKKEWQEIAGDSMSGQSNGSYKKALDQATEYGLSSGTERSTLIAAYSNLEFAMKVIIGFSSGSWTNANMGNDTYIGAEYEGNDRFDIVYPSGWTYYGTDVNRNVFAKLWREYYDAEIALLNKVQVVIDTREIGGENLYTGVDPLAVGTSRKSTGITLENGKKYVISIGTISGNAASLFAEEKTGTTYTNIGYLVSRQSADGTTVTYTNTTLVVTGSGGTLYLIGGASGSGQGWTLTNIMVQKGERPTAYQNSYKYLADAFTHDATKQTTDIDGGLLATSLVLLRNQSNQVRAGISGLDDDGKKIQNGALVVDANSHGVGFFAGGTYAEALAAAAGNGDIPVLLTKDGILSRIGCLRVVDKDTVKVVTDNNEIVLTNGSISNAAPSAQSVEGDGTININKEYSEGESTITYSSAAISSTFPKGNYSLTSNATSIDVKIQIRTSRYGQYAWYQGRAQFTFKIELYVKVGGSIASTQTVGTYQTDIYSTGNSDTNSRTDTIQISTKTLTFACNSNNTSVEIGYRLIDTSVVVSNITGSGAKGILTIDNETITSKLIQTNRYVVIAKDGIAIINSSEAMFKISNGSGQLNLYASGLPTSATGLSSGQLYKDGNYLKIV